MPVSSVSRWNPGSRRNNLFPGKLDVFLVFEISFIILKTFGETFVKTEQISPLVNFRIPLYILFRKLINLKFLAGR